MLVSTLVRRRATETTTRIAAYLLNYCKILLAHRNLAILSYTVCTIASLDREEYLLMLCTEFQMKSQQNGEVIARPDEVKSVDGGS